MPSERPLCLRFSRGKTSTVLEWTSLSRITLDSKQLGMECEARFAKRLPVCRGFQTTDKFPLAEPQNTRQAQSGGRKFIPADALFSMSYRSFPARLRAKGASVQTKRCYWSRLEAVVLYRDGSCLPRKLKSLRNLRSPTRVMGPEASE